MTARDVRRDGLPVEEQARRLLAAYWWGRDDTVNASVLAADSVHELAEAGLLRDDALDADPDTPTADTPADTDLRVDMREAIYYCLTDASMWIGDDGQPLDYLPAREALMGEFLDEAVDALLPLVRAQVEAARRDALARAEATAWICYERDVPERVVSLDVLRAARGETRQPADTDTGRGQ